jgi:membrane protease subunit HflC
MNGNVLRTGLVVLGVLVLVLIYASAFNSAGCAPC